MESNVRVRFSKQSLGRGYGEGLAQLQLIALSILEMLIPDSCQRQQQLWSVASLR